MLFLNVANVTPIDSHHRLSNEDIQALSNKASQYYSYTKNEPLIVVSALSQSLLIIQHNIVLYSYKISTAEAGLGNKMNSYQTPCGMHEIKQKIGQNAELGAIFKGRKETGEIANILLGVDERSPKDNITTRILWLNGLEDGVNRGENIDSYSRYIYIHGTDEEGRLGSPASHGCIRMANQDIVELFELVSSGTLVYITE